MPKIQELQGKVFGRLTVVKFAEMRGHRAIWECMCVCGAIRLIHATNLRAGYTKSCGCLRDERVRKAICTHGKAGTPEYRVWKSMIKRCKYEKYWAGRGIKVCRRWATSFTNFLEDMGPKQSKESLDRIDNDGDYEPGNCRWATRVTQSRNTRANRLITYDGVTRTVAEWAEVRGIKYMTLYYRLFHYGWDTKRALCY